MSKNLTSSAQCAIVIRKELKAAFPHIKFTVRSESYSGGDSIRVGWLFGPTEEQIEALIGKYQYGRFNGMEDIYEYNSNQLEHGVKYLFCQRSEMAKDERQKLLDLVGNEFGMIKQDHGEWMPEQWNGVSGSTMAYRIMRECEFVSDSIELLDIKYIDYGKHKSFEPFTLIYKDLKTGDIHDCKQGIVKRAERSGEVKKAVEVVELSGNISVLDYSEKSFVIIGDTYPIRTQLRELGGGYNKFLTHPESKEKVAGWIFPLSKKETILGVIKA